MTLTKILGQYYHAIVLALLLVVAWYLAQMPFNLWLPGYSLLPEWLQDRTLFFLVATYYVNVILAAFLLGSAIFVFVV